MLNEYILGSLIGGWVGDASGAPLEFYHKEITDEKVNKVMKMCGGGVLQVGPGQITDDSELELSLLDVLLKTPRSEDYPIEEVAQGYIEWGRSNPFDKGRTCSNAFCTSQNHIEMIKNASILNFNSKSNGGLMRIAPIGIWARDKSIDEIIQIAKSDAQLSHPNIVCQEVNAIYSVLIAFLIKNPGKHIDAINFVKPLIQNEEVEAWFEKAQHPQFLDKINCRDNIGFVKHGFSLVIYFLYHQIPFEEAIHQTLKKGGDTDTNAKIVGSLLGALYGLQKIPKYMIQPVLDFDGKNGIQRPPKYNIQKMIQRLQLPNELLS